METVYYDRLIGVRYSAATIPSGHPFCVVRDWYRAPKQAAIWLRRIPVRVDLVNQYTVEIDARIVPIKYLQQDAAAIEALPIFARHEALWPRLINMCRENKWCPLLYRNGEDSLAFDLVFVYTGAPIATFVLTAAGVSRAVNAVPTALPLFTGDHLYQPGPVKPFAALIAHVMGQPEYIKNQAAMLQRAIHYAMILFTQFFTIPDGSHYPHELLGHVLKQLGALRSRLQLTLQTQNLPTDGDFAQQLSRLLDRLTDEPTDEETDL